MKDFKIKNNHRFFLLFSLFFIGKVGGETKPESLKEAPDLIDKRIKEKSNNNKSLSPLVFLSIPLFFFLYNKGYGKKKKKKGRSKKIQKPHTISFLGANNEWESTQTNKKMEEIIATSKGPWILKGSGDAARLTPFKDIKAESKKFIQNNFQNSLKIDRSFQKKCHKKTYQALCKTQYIKKLRLLCYAVDPINILQKDREGRHYALFGYKKSSSEEVPTYYSECNKKNSDSFFPAILAFYKKNVLPLFQNFALDFVKAFFAGITYELTEETPLFIHNMTRYTHPEIRIIFDGTKGKKEKINEKIDKETLKKILKNAFDWLEKKMSKEWNKEASTRFWKKIKNWGSTKKKGFFEKMTEDLLPKIEKLEKYNEADFFSQVHQSMESTEYWEEKSLPQYLQKKLEDNAPKKEKNAYIEKLLQFGDKKLKHHIVKVLAAYNKKIFQNLSSPQKNKLKMKIKKLLLEDVREKAKKKDKKAMEKHQEIIDFHMPLGCFWDDLSHQIGEIVEDISEN